MENIQITSDGIQKNLRRVKPYDSICEYMWNGFDAGASIIRIECSENQFGYICSLSISDNGSGIDYSELSQKFKPFNNSEKYQSKEDSLHHSIPHGKNGVGRLTFFSFASDAEWNTVYKDKDGINKSYTISMSRETLNEYNPNNGNAPYVTSEHTGTTVSFVNVSSINEDEMIQTIQNKFFWFMCLYSYKNYRVVVNGKDIDFNQSIKDSFSIELNSNNDINHNFQIRAIMWNSSLGLEYSKYYFVNSKGEEVYKENTTLNKKSDDFWHSVIIKSDYFDEFNFNNCDDGQLCFTSGKNDKEYKTLIEEINNKLVEKRRNYLQAASKNYIDKLIEAREYPQFGTSVLDGYRKEQLDGIVSSLYQAEPKIFTSLNSSQKKIFVRFINTIMDSDDKDSLFKAIEEVIELNDIERKDFAELLEKTTLSNIISTIRLIKDRIAAVQALKEVIFNNEFHAYEVKHVQAIVEKHFWLFGEQYHLLTSAEPDFNEALRRLIYATTGNKDKVNIEHEDVNKEMDIFMNRQNKTSGYFENIVVELKRPSVAIGEEQLSQVKKYMNVIQSDDRFNSNNSKWTYYLIGNHFDSKGYIKGELESNINHGESGIVYKTKSQKIYVKTWSEIFEDFEVKSEYLLERLEFDEKLWLQKHNSADEAVNAVINNSAHLSQLAIPQR